MMKISIRAAIDILTFSVFLLMLGSGYFLYTSYTKFEDSKKLSKYINISNDLSTLLINIGKEQLQSSVYVLSKNSIPFVKDKEPLQYGQISPSFTSAISAKYATSLMIPKSTPTKW